VGIQGPADHKGGDVQKALQAGLLLERLLQQVHVLHLLRCALKPNSQQVTRQQSTGQQSTGQPSAVNRATVNRSTVSSQQGNSQQVNRQQSIGQQSAVNCALHLLRRTLKPNSQQVNSQQSTVSSKKCTPYPPEVSSQQPAVNRSTASSL
jgi:hypothetical protein